VINASNSSQFSSSIAIAFASAQLREEEAFLQALAEYSIRRSAEREKLASHMASLRPGLSLRALMRAFPRLRRKVEMSVIERSGLFNAQWYASRYADIKGGSKSAVRHYYDHGAREGRDPGPAFSTKNYLSSYPDVTMSGMNPLLHFLLMGNEEGRQAEKVVLPHCNRNVGTSD